MPKRTARVLLPPIRIERRSGTPLHRQVYGAFRQAILSAQVPPGNRLPSTRSLARTLGVSRNTVAQAYEQLLAEGYLKARVGSGTRAARAMPETYLRDLPLITKDAFGRRGKTFRNIVFEACFPARTARFADTNDNTLHLFEN